MNDLGSDMPVGSRSNADIIVVGAGGAGLTCALAAATRGAKVLLIEREPVLGGTFLVSGGTYAAANSRLTQMAGTDDGPDRHYADALRVGRGFNNPGLLRTIVDHAGPTLDWLLDMGLRLDSDRPRVAVEHEPYLVPRTYGAVGGGRGFLAVLVPAVEAHVAVGNICLKLETSCTGIVRGADGAAAGVMCESRDGTRAVYSAPSIVMAAGGYGGSLEMVRKLNPGFETCVTLCPRNADGSVMLAAQNAGAEIVNVKALRPYPGVIPEPPDPWYGVFLGHIVRMQGAVAHGGFWVDSHGRRFISEETPSPDPIEEAILGRIPDVTVFVVFDDKRRRASPDCPIPIWDWDTLTRAADTGDSRVASASSVRELAERMGIDGDRLERTAAEWNAAVERGADVRFGRKSLVRLDTPPYYAIFTKGALLMTGGGVSVDGQCRVLDGGGRAISGLYAIGEILGACQYMGHGFVSGLGNVCCLALGKLLGEELADRRGA